MYEHASVLLWLTTSADDVEQMELKMEMVSRPGLVISVSEVGKVLQQLRSGDRTVFATHPHKRYPLEAPELIAVVVRYRYDNATGVGSFSDQVALGTPWGFGTTVPMETACVQEMWDYLVEMGPTAHVLGAGNE